MVVRDLFHELDDARVIARTIYEDDWKPEEIDAWITTYYAQLTKLKTSKIRKSDMMFYLTVIQDEKRIYGDVSGFLYKDIKAGNEIYYTIEILTSRQYASLYVPEYTVQRYGKEVVASEALREYGWNDYDDKIICPDDVRFCIKKELETMTSGIFPVDKNYLFRCRKQFKLSYEGKEVPLWEGDKDAPGI
ncbi:MAG: hypothetical protein ACI4F4_04580 [Lachnospiraceae bacterium]